MNKWRFPASNYGKAKGISSGDEETFKKSPYKSFAREILQNSIDAKLDSEEKVTVDFELLKIPTSSIPGIEDYKKAIENIIAYWEHKPEYVKEYQKILSKLRNDEIRCLKVSDYNTTGLNGVSKSSLEGNKFKSLTMGTGVSEKSSAVSGGSKGVGKNAAFMLSALKMVFYSTITSDNEKGCLGVTELISGYVDSSRDPKTDHTQGSGYFASNDNNDAIQNFEDVTVFNYGRNTTGTDITIVGFEPEEDWDKEIINSLLDSFMAAIIREKLEVKFNGTLINKDTIKNIVYSEVIFEKNKANIVSQYNLLTGNDDIKVFDIETDYGTPRLYVWSLKKEELKYATHECAMIRSPLMKIKKFDLNKSFNVSALCIIGADKLGENLLAIENPQHIDWEPKRIKDTAVRKEIQSVINSIKEQINKHVVECLKLDDNKQIDPNGAGEYLPEDFNGTEESSSSGNMQTDITDTATVSKKKENTAHENKTGHENGQGGQGMMPTPGTSTEEGEDSTHPSGNNEGGGGKENPGKEEGGAKEGDNIVFKKTTLGVTRYNFICTNKEEGQYKITFIAPETRDDCYLNVLLIDDSNNKDNIAIESMKVNGIDINSDDGIEYGPFSIEMNKKIIIEAKLTEHEYFGGEVKVVCK